MWGSDCSAQAHTSARSMRRNVHHKCKRKHKDTGCVGRTDTAANSKTPLGKTLVLASIGSRSFGRLPPCWTRGPGFTPVLRCSISRRADCVCRCFGGCACPAGSCSLLVLHIPWLSSGVRGVHQRPRTIAPRSPCTLASRHQRNGPLLESAADLVLQRALSGRQLLPHPLELCVSEHGT